MRQQIKHFVLVCVLSILLFQIAFFTLGQAGAAPNESRTRQNVIVNLSPETLTITGTQTYTPTKSFLIANNETGILTMTLAVGGALEGDTLKVGSNVTTGTIIAATNTSMAAALTISQNDVANFTLFNSQWVLDNAQDNAPD